MVRVKKKKEGRQGKIRHEGIQYAIMLATFHS